MTRIDFHFNAAGKLNYTCRLARKALTQGSRMVIFSSERKVLAELDRELWTFSTLDFLPHCFLEDPLSPHTPIVLSHDLAEPPHYDVLINIDQQRPEFFSRFGRVIEIVGTEDGDRLAARERWKYYRDRGYALTHYDINGAGT